MEYKNEEEFLKKYNVNEFERPSVTSDVLLLSVSNGIQNNYRKLKDKYYSVLLVKRKEYPFKGKWCLPGGFVKSTETTEEAAKRVLASENKESYKIKLKLQEKLEKYNFDVVEENYDLSIAIGGDGSFLRIVNKKILKD